MDAVIPSPLLALHHAHSVASMAGASPPVAGSPSGQGVKDDIAPVSTDGRTPGAAKSANKAPWRSPGVALARRDENTPSGGGAVPPQTAPNSAKGALGTRKLDARSPLTAGEFKTRGGKPRLETEIASDGPSVDDQGCDDDAVTAAVDVANTVLPTPPSARGTLPRCADTNTNFDTAAMPPPPPRVPVTTNDAALDSCGEIGTTRVSLASAVSDDAGDAADHDVDLGAATTAIPRHDVEARTTNETSDGMDTRDTVEEEKEEEEEEEDSTDPKTPRAPASPFGTETSPAPIETDTLYRRVEDDLTPLRAVGDTTSHGGFGFREGVTARLPHLATPTMDLTPLRLAHAAAASPAVDAPAALTARHAVRVTLPSKHKDAVQIQKPQTKRGFDATLFDAEDFEMTEQVPELFSTTDFEPTERVAVPNAAKTPGGSSKIPTGGRPPTPKTVPKPAGASTPQWAKDSKAWHAQQQAQMESLMAQARRELEEARGVTTGETSEAEERQQALCLMLEQQKAELDAQRLELRAEREEQTKMKATLQLQMEAQERTRRRVSEIAARNHGPPGTSMDCLLSQSMDLAEFANDAALASGGAPPNLVPVEQQLRACRDAISARAVESERLAARQRQLQREEADLHFRVAELQRYALRLALDPNSQVPQDLPPMPPPFVGETQFNTKPSDTSAALAYFSAVAATRTQHVHRTASGTMDEDGFYVVDPAGPNLSNSGGSGVTTVGSLGEAGDPVGTSAAVTSSGRKTGGYGARGEIGAADGTATAAATAAPATSKAPVDAIDSIGSRLAPTQVLELRKEVLDLRFVGYGGDSGGADAGDDQTPPSALMTATSDGCLRLFQAGARRPVAIIRGPKEGIAAVASVGVEAFVAAAGPGGYVARYDLAAGRELGALLAVPAEDGYEQTVSTSAPRRLQCVAAGGPGSGLVAAAGEGGDVYLWDSRVAPRGSRRTGGNTPAGAGSGSFGSAGVAPVMTLRVPGASSITSVSLARDGVTLAAIASNGARVFDLRAPASDRPARLASLEPGQRWACATHVGDEIFTTSTTGDVFAWQRKDDTGYGAPWKSARAHREACGFPGNGAADASTTSINTTDMSSRPAFAASAYAFGVDNKRVVLSASGSRGECVRAWDASSGDTIGEWGADGRSLDGAGASAAHQFREYGMNTGGHASVTAACWGSGAEGARFGKTSFAVGNAEGVVRVYGP